MEDFFNFVSSDFFANLCQFFSAVGTVAAVVISLVFSFFSKKIKYKISSNTMNVYDPLDSNFWISGYSVKIVNCSDERNIYLKQGLYFATGDFKKEKKVGILLPIIELEKYFSIQKNLGPGEEFEFFISKKHINSILSNCKKNKIKFYFMDKYNKKYYITIKRNVLEERLKFLENNNDKIVDY